jgi:hypothetical protein
MTTVNKGKRTFQDGKKTDKGHSIAVCSTHIVVNVANGHIEWVVLVLAIVVSASLVYYGTAITA